MSGKGSTGEDPEKDFAAQLTDMLVSAIERSETSPAEKAANNAIEIVQQAIEKSDGKAATAISSAALALTALYHMARKSTTTELEAQDDVIKFIKDSWSMGARICKLTVDRRRKCPCDGCQKFVEGYDREHAPRGDIVSDGDQNSDSPWASSSD